MVLRFRGDHSPDEAVMQGFAEDVGFRIAEGSTSLALREGQLEWRLAFIAQTSRSISIPGLAEGLRKIPFLENFQIAFARN